MCIRHSEEYNYIIFYIIRVLLLVSFFLIKPLASSCQWKPERHPIASDPFTCFVLKLQQLASGCNILWSNF
jgi:hypothetical protein